MSEPPDPSAFWLYPDWDGPLKQPFWMRPLKLPKLPKPLLCIDLGAFDDEGRPLTRVKNNPSPGQYFFDAVTGHHYANGPKRYFGRRLKLGPAGAPECEETLTYEDLAYIV